MLYEWRRSCTHAVGKVLVVSAAHLQAALAGQAEAAEHDVDVAAVQLAVAGGSAALWEKLRMPNDSTNAFSPTAMKVIGGAGAGSASDWAVPAVAGDVDR